MVTVRGDSISNRDKDNQGCRKSARRQRTDSCAESTAGIEQSSAGAGDGLGIGSRLGSLRMPDAHKYLIFIASPRAYIKLHSLTATTFSGRAIREPNRRYGKIHSCPAF